MCKVFISFFQEKKRMCQNCSLQNLTIFFLFMIFFHYWKLNKDDIFGNKYKLGSCVSKLQLIDVRLIPWFIRIISQLTIKAFIACYQFGVHLQNYHLNSILSRLDLNFTKWRLKEKMWHGLYFIIAVSYWSFSHNIWGLGLNTKKDIWSWLALQKG